MLCYHQHKPLLQHKKTLGDYAQFLFVLTKMVWYFWLLSIFLACSRSCACSSRSSKNIEHPHPWFDKWKHSIISLAWWQMLMYLSTVFESINYIEKRAATDKKSRSFGLIFVLSHENFWLGPQTCSLKTMAPLLSDHATRSYVVPNHISRFAELHPVQSTREYEWLCCHL